MQNNQVTSQNTQAQPSSNQEKRNVTGIDRSRSIVILIICVAICVGFYFLGKMI